MNRGLAHGPYQGDRLRQTVWNSLEALLGAFRSPAPFGRLLPSLCVSVCECLVFEIVLIRSCRSGGIGRLVT